MPHTRMRVSSPRSAERRQKKAGMRSEQVRRLLPRAAASCWVTGALRARGARLPVTRLHHELDKNTDVSNLLDRGLLECGEDGTRSSPYDEIVTRTARERRRHGVERRRESSASTLGDPPAQSAKSRAVRPLIVYVQVPEIE
jgi:hypothetical protein